MKGKSVTFRPKVDFRERLDILAEAIDRPITWILEKCIEGHLPALEKKYAEDLLKYRETLGGKVAIPETEVLRKAQSPTLSNYSSTASPQHVLNETNGPEKKAKPKKAA